MIRLTIGPPKRPLGVAQRRLYTVTWGHETSSSSSLKAFCEKLKIPYATVIQRMWDWPMGRFDQQFTEIIREIRQKTEAKRAKLATACPTCGHHGYVPTNSKEVSDE